MSVNPISLSSNGSLSGHSDTPIYQPRDILSSDFELAQQAAEFLASHTPTQESVEMVNALNEAVAQKNADAIKLGFNHALFHPPLLSILCNSNEWVLDQVTSLLCKLPQDLPVAISKMVTATSICYAVLNKQSERLNSELIKNWLIQRWVTPHQLNMLTGQSNPNPIFIQLFEEALTSDNQQFAHIFNQTSIPKMSFENALQTERFHIVFSLLKYCFIHESDLKSPLENEGLKSHFTAQTHFLLEESIHGVIQTLISLDVPLSDESVALIFHWIEEDRSFWQVNTLLCHGLSPDLTSALGWTLLQQAVLFDRPGIVDTLIKKEANSLTPTPDGRTVFELAKGKNPKILDLLYYPEKYHYSGNSWERKYNPSITIPEEEALGKILEQRCRANKGVGYYYSLFIKVNEVVLVLLKPSGFSDQFPRFSEATFLQKRNRVHCWSPHTLYSIPQEHVPTVNSMETICLRILRVPENPDKYRHVQVEREWFDCTFLQSEYRAFDSSLERGFKYSESGVQVRGHEANPNAIRSAFNTHKKEAERLKDIFRIPEISSELGKLSKIHQVLENQSKIEEKNTAVLKTFSEQFTCFFKEAESIIDWRSSRMSTDPDEKARILKRHTEVQESMVKLSQQILTDERLSQWKNAIAANIELLQTLEAKLIEAHPVDQGHIASEIEAISNSVCGVAEIITSRTITSAIGPTFRVYQSENLVDDALSPDGCCETVRKLRYATCELITSSLIGLVNYEVVKRENFLDEAFREKRITQHMDEATWIGQFCESKVEMQKLASALAQFKENSNALAKFNLPNRKTKEYLRDECFGLHLKIREHLDVCWNALFEKRDFVAANFENLYPLLLQRILLMDEEIQLVNRDSIVYPDMGVHKKWHFLNEQLFLLQHTMLIVQGLQPSIPIIDLLPEEKTAEYVQLHLKPAAYGSSKTPKKLYNFFVCNLLELVGKLQEIVATAETPLLSNQLTKRLTQTKLPSKKMLEEVMKETFRALTPGELNPKFSKEVLDLFDLFRFCNQDVNSLPDALMEDEAEFLTPIRSLSEKVDSVLKNFQFSSDDDEIDPLVLLQKIKNAAEVTPEALDKALISGLGSKVGKQLEKLKQQAKKITSFDQFEIDRAKRFQTECTETVDRIEEFVRFNQTDVTINPINRELCADKILALDQISEGMLSQSINIIEPSIEMLNKEGVNELTMTLQLSKLVKQMRESLNSKRQKELKMKCDAAFGELNEIVEHALNAQKMEALTSLTPVIQNVRESLKSIFLKKITKMGDELTAGIRMQTHYKQDGSDETFYLWEGLPFNGHPRHTADELHIPFNG